MIRIQLKNLRVVIKGVILGAVFIILSCNKSHNENTSVIIFSKIYPPANYKITGAIVNGKKTGLWITYDSIGRIEAEETFIDGKSFGETKVYSNGDLMGKTIDRIVKSDTVSYFEKYNAYGKVITKGQYINGQKRGVWIYYFNNGKDLKSKINYLQKGSQVLLQSQKYWKDDY
jgi:antitoxin component YwqK of YwqJK toxin-antitoxin module